MSDKRKGGSWDKITQSKEDGGLGIREFIAMEEATTIKEATMLWEGSGFL